MTVDGFFDLYGRDILPSGNNDVLATVGNLYITVGMHNCYITSMKPAAFKGFSGCAFILQITHHHGVALEQQLTSCLAVFWYWLHSFGVSDH
ncbi:hypothetical protein D3C81_828890 [compost metagenome]